jgi:hypothetical protein
VNVARAGRSELIQSGRGSVFEQDVDVDSSESLFENLFQQRVRIGRRGFFEAVVEAVVEVVEAVIPASSGRSFEKLFA